MPLLYGEGDMAFFRLQEEMIKKSSDQSIFAWIDSSPATTQYSGLRATSPDYFVKGINPLGIWGEDDGYSISNEGLGLKLFLVPLPPEPGVYQACLDCIGEDSSTSSPAICLKLHFTTHHAKDLPDGQSFSRIRTNELDMVDSTAKDTPYL
jgi:hypothetical protein